MSTLTTIQSTDLITNSRANINDNFAALNAEKIETSVLDTDTTLAANSDSKVATQKAVKAYVDAGGQPNASETAKGLVELATASQYSAKTATGETGAALVTPNSIGPVIETTAGTTHSLTTIANQRVMVWASGHLSFNGTAADRTITIKYNAVTKQSLSCYITNTGGDKVPFSLMYTETPGAATQNITVGTDGGTLANVVIMVLKF